VTGFSRLVRSIGTSIAREASSMVIALVPVIVIRDSLSSPIIVM